MPRVEKSLIERVACSLIRCFCRSRIGLSVLLLFCPPASAVTCKSPNMHLLLAVALFVFRTLPFTWRRPAYMTKWKLKHSSRWRQSMHHILVCLLLVCCILVSFLLLPFSLGALAVETLRTSSIEAKTPIYAPLSREKAKARKKMARAQYKLDMLSLQQIRAARLREIACRQDRDWGSLIVGWVFWCAFCACICICNFLVCLLCLLTMRVQLWTNLLLFCSDLAVGVVDCIAFAKEGFDCVHGSAEGGLGLNLRHGPADLELNLAHGTAEGGLALWCRGCECQCGVGRPFATLLQATRRCAERRHEEASGSQQQEGRGRRGNGAEKSTRGGRGDASLGS